MSVRWLSKSSSRIASFLAVLICAALPRVAVADSADAAKAEALFLAGKERLAREDYASACPMFAESFRLDAATGTLLALAICHERAGKLASAYSAYNEVLARSKQDAREDRERAARERSTALAARLSTLTLSNSEVSRLVGLEMRVDGSVIDPGQFGKRMPIDGGTHVIEAWAPGKKTWRTTLVLAASIDSRTVIVPQLESQAPPAPEQAQEIAAPLAKTRKQPQRRAATPSRGPTTTQWWGIAATSAGLVGLAVGALFTTRALSENQDSKAGCEHDVCTAAARRDRLDAREAGNVSTIAFAAGGALAVTGLVLVLAGGESGTESRRTLGAAAWVAPSAAGATLHGYF